MIYQTLVDLSDHLSALNVFRYITFRSFLAFFTTFASCLLLGPWFIQKMKAKQFAQSIRDDGPASHKKKSGTPTMGGALMLLAILPSLFLWVDLTEPLVLGALFIMFGFGLVGFFDDWAKVSKKNHRGVPGKLRLAAEFMIAGLAIAVLVQILRVESVVHLPFFKNIQFDLGWGYVLFASLVVVGTANAVNLTDGLDGLAIVPIVVSTVTLALFAYVTGHQAIASYLQLAHVTGSGELVPLAASVAAAGLGFLWFNAYPAQIFMGDVGSLSLGGFIGAMAVLTNNEILMVILGGIFVVEALSVIGQVVSFKTTGKRIFKMAPIHHHFELGGMTETKIIVRFWIVAILLALICLTTLKLR